MISTTTLAYTAGLVDGEGSIMLLARRAGAFKRAAVSISSTSIELLNFLPPLFGGYILTKKSRPRFDMNHAYPVATHKR